MLWCLLHRLWPDDDQSLQGVLAAAPRARHRVWTGRWRALHYCDLHLAQLLCEEACVGHGSISVWQLTGWRHLPSNFREHPGEDRIRLDGAHHRPHLSGHCGHPMCRDETSGKTARTEKDFRLRASQGGPLRDHESGHLLWIRWAIHSLFLHRTVRCSTQDGLFFLHAYYYERRLDSRTYPPQSDRRQILPPTSRSSRVHRRCNFACILLDCHHREHSRPRCLVFLVWILLRRFRQFAGSCRRVFHDQHGYDRHALWHQHVLRCSRNLDRIPCRRCHLPCLVGRLPAFLRFHITLLYRGDCRNLVCFAA